MQSWRKTTYLHFCMTISKLRDFSTEIMFVPFHKLKANIEISN